MGYKADEQPKQNIKQKKKKPKPQAMYTPNILVFHL